MIAAMLVTVGLTCIFVKMMICLARFDDAFAVNALHRRGMGQGGTIDDICRILASARIGGVRHTRLSVRDKMRLGQACDDMTHADLITRRFLSI